MRRPRIGRLPYLLVFGFRERTVIVIACAVARILASGAVGWRVAAMKVLTATERGAIFQINFSANYIWRDVIVVKSGRPSKKSGLHWLQTSWYCWSGPPAKQN
jgi:hypothetical protein